MAQAITGGHGMRMTILGVALVLVPVLFTSPAPGQVREEREAELEQPDERQQELEAPRYEVDSANDEAAQYDLEQPDERQRELERPRYEYR
jgi:hypothetical protein